MVDESYEHHYIGFYTASILKWQKLLAPDKYKEIMMDSLHYLVTEERIKLYGYVIMPNHIHLLWKMQPPHLLKNVQRDFMKFTANQIKLDLKENHPQVLPHFQSTQADRKYQFWQRNALTTYLYSRETVEQKLGYIHHNPMQGKWMLCDTLDGYGYSSYRFYEFGENTKGIMSHYMELYE